MAGQSTILGYLKEPYIHNKNILSVQSHNRAKIFSLGRMNESPSLNSTFFSESGDSETFSNSLIYFAGTFNEIEFDWEEWLEKFENLLKILYWESVYLRLETYFGDFEYKWQATDEIIATFNQEFPKRVTEWIFTGEPRKFHN